MAPLTRDTLSAVDQQLRLPARLLTFQVLLSIATVLGLVVVYPSISLSPDRPWTEPIKRAQEVAWITHHVLLLLAYGTGAVAILLLARLLLTTPARIAAWVALIVQALCLLLWIVYMGVRMSLLNLSAPTIGELGVYQTSQQFVPVLTVLGLIATLAISVALWRAGLARRTGLVVAVLTALLLPLVLFLPPFVFNLLWLPLGITLLRRRPSERVIDGMPVLS